jgi:PAS domain S-box-containing protein
MTDQDRRSRAADPSAGLTGSPQAGSGQDLRQKAEARAGEEALRTTEYSAALSPEETRKTLHELRVHQIELEMQNEELRRTQVELEAARARYFDLYDLAPVGYVTLSEKGLIREANLTAAALLGVERRALAGSPLSRFIPAEDQDIYYLHTKRLFAAGRPQTCELRLMKPDGAVFWARLDSTAAQGDDGAPACRVVLSDITEHKRDESKLEESEFQYRSLANAGLALIWTSGTDKLCNYFNEAWLKFTGRTLEQEMGNGWAEGVHPDDFDRCLETYVTAFDKREPFEMEYRLRHASGEYRVVLDLGTQRVNSKGEFIGYIGHCFDITQRKQFEKNLHESEEKYRILFNAFPLGITISDPSGNIVESNARAAALLGIPKDEHETRRIDGDQWRIIRPDGTPMPAEEYASVRFLKENRLVEKVEMGIVKPDAEIAWLNVTAAPLLLENYGVVVTYDDITDRKKAEEGLKKSEDKFEGFFLQIPDYAYIVSPDGRISDVNPAAFHALGYEREELLHKPLATIYAPESIDKMKDLFLRWQQKGQLINEEIVIMTKTGDRRNVLLNVGAVRDEAGEILHSVSIQTDITERKQAEAEHRELEERLQRAEKMESLGTLAGGVAHDLNNVLGIVVGYAEMLMGEMDEANPMRDDLEKILEGGNRSAAIVQDLLTLARRGVQTKKTVNLNAAIMDCQKLPEFEKVFSHNRQVKLQMDFESDLLNIMGSPVHIGKTIINLAANAVEAMPNGGVLKIATANQYLDVPIHGYDKIREGDYVILTVSDTGEGIPERDIKRIFEPFYTKKIMGRSGTGLGLAVVWGTVKDHNGYINVASEEGKGTTFTLYFPVTREEIAIDQVPVSMSEYMGRGETILVVDDINRQRELASRMLRKLNYRVNTVASGEEAIEYLKTNKADLIVLDMIMDPGIDGLETYEHILKLNPVQKAVIVSGFSESDRVKEAQRIGAGAYVPKPYVLERLGLAVRKELDRK